MNTIIAEVSHPYGEWAVQYPGPESVTVYFDTIDEAAAFLVANPCTSDQGMSVKFSVVNSATGKDGI